MRYWLMKSEPGTGEGKYSIDDFKKDKRSDWTGVRNYQARNFMSKEMDVGDGVLFYHSNAEPSGAVGVARVSRTAEPDQKQFDKKGKYYEPRATKEKPVWFCVEIEFVEKFPRIVSIGEIRENKKLAKMALLQKGSRLSIQPVTDAEFKEVCRMAKAKP